MSKPPILARVLIEGRRVRLAFFPGTGPQLAELHGKVVEVREKRARRSVRQNARYWALLTVGADSIWGDKSLAEDLHEEIAHLLLALPPCEKTGMRRRMRTPKLNTAEFGVYMDHVVDKLIEFGADLSAWDEEAKRMEAA